MNEAPLQRTPALDRLLGRLRRRLVLAVWLHGAGTALIAAAAWTFFAFTADFWLRVPAAVRMLHGVVLLGVTGFFLWRDLLRPMRRIPDKAGLALLLERRHGGLFEVLVSAVQLQVAGTRSDDHEASPELVDAVLREAEERAASLDAAGVLAEAGPRVRLGSGALLSGLLVLAAMLNPGLARIFLDHLLGGRTPWPQRTHLTIDVPLAEAAGRVTQDGDVIAVRIARGTDVPVVVRAEGVEPSEVVLRFEDGRDRALSPSGRGIYRTSLRSPQQSVAFHATGGDDDDDRPRVEIEVLQPPDVEGVAIMIEPPAWTGLAPSLAFNRDVEVVAGSHLRVHVLPTPRTATGVVRLLPEDATLPLVPAPFPPDEDDDIHVEEGLAFELDATSSLGYRFELVDDTGLSNPEPGLFRITVLEDRPPELRLFAPGRSEFETVAGGAIPLRALAEDDFGLVAMTFEARVFDPARASAADAGADGDLRLQAEFEPHKLPPAGGRTPWLGATRVEVADLLGVRPGETGEEADAPPADESFALDQRFEILVTARDNHLPDGQVGRAAPVRVRLISADELLRRMQDRLARARLGATRLADLQREKQARVLELVDALSPGGALAADDSLALHAAAVGQRRVQSDAATLTRDLAMAAQDVLYARLDEKAGPMLELLDARSGTVADGAFHAEVWTELTAAFDRGELGAPVFAGNLVQLVARGLAVSEESALAAALELDRAQKASTVEDAAAALAAAHEHQAEALRRVELLLESLAEWDNFQNVLTLTRDILQRQKALRDRTRRYAQESER